MKKIPSSGPARSKKPLWRRILIPLALVFFGINTFFLLLACISPYISPRFFWSAALVGLFFKAFFFIQLIFTALFLWKGGRKIRLIALALLIPCLPSSFHTFAFHPFGGSKPDKHALKLMTYNVADLLWFEDTVSLNKIVSNIHEEQPDIICMQEYFVYPKKHRAFLQRMTRKEGYPYYYEFITGWNPETMQVGMAIFSRLPMRNITPIPFYLTTNGALRADFVQGMDTFRLINVHFQSLSMQKREYVLGTSAAGRGGVSRANLLKVSMHKFRSAFRQRSYQAGLIENVIDSSPYKVILCGDFNDSPVSYVYRRMTKKLDDSWLETSFGLGSSFAGRIPFQRIDYILTDPGIKVFKTHLLRKKGSDHYPLICEFSLRSG
jgi:endonuclease/exonuclease/phosphatase family metal-dependent hydrolase